MTIPHVHRLNVHVSLPSEITLYEGSPELIMLGRNLQTLVPYMLKMMMETTNTTGELRVLFKDSQVVDEGPGKKRPKVLLD